MYFYLAVFEALGDIKAQWTRTKTKLLKLINKNTSFSGADKHYLRFLLKVGNAMEQVLCGKTVALKPKLQQQYSQLAAEVDTGRLGRYLCRQVRKYHIKPKTGSADGFAITERAYRYGDHGIYISAKEKRQRIFIPLTDNNSYKRQLYIKLYPQQANVAIRVPVDVKVQNHPDYGRQVGLAFGMSVMLTTDEGHKYGEAFGQLQGAYTGWLYQQAKTAGHQGREGGRRKYKARKHRLEGRLHSYINQELNRFLREEKPLEIYLPKLPGPQAGGYGYNKHINFAVSGWQRGYIRRRLMQKCREHSVTVTEVFGKGVSSVCSRCGAAGVKKGGVFTCPVCGSQEEDKVNTARNAKIRGQEHRAYPVN